MPRFWTIDAHEKTNLFDAMRGPLSGYIGGDRSSGKWCERLSDEWSEAFGVTYATPCNSATSGLLAACMAADIGPDDVVWVSSYTMSASATCAIFLGANVKFVDIEPDTFCMSTNWLHLVGSSVYGTPKAIIVTNLFGCPADLKKFREFCDLNGIILIEDNAQAPFAALNGEYTGTIGHLGVFSLNVHKHLQCGEGGVVVTNDPQLAHKVDCAINHGELMKTDPAMGLNLRMTEPIAAIASAQLAKGKKIVQSRIDVANEISGLFYGIDFVELPREPEGARHVYYMWAGKIKGKPNGARGKFLATLKERGLPFREGYSKPLHRLLSREADTNYPITCELEDKTLFTFEICAFSPRREDINRMRRIIDQEARKIK